MTRFQELSHSLRARLIAVTLLAQVAVLALITVSALNLLHGQLLGQARVRVQELNVLLKAALSGPLAQVDYAVVAEILDATRTRQGLRYLQVVDDLGQVLVTSASPPAQPLGYSDPDPGNDGGDGVYDALVPLDLAGQPLGTLRYGLSTDFIRQARGAGLGQSLVIAVLAMLFFVAVLSGLSIWLMRHLERLIAAAEAISTGRYDIRLPASKAGELGRLMNAFNRMALSLQSREEELRHSQSHLIFLAERDSLTGLYNRHFFRQELQRRLDEALREGIQGALLLFDLDEFKLINDTFGHQAGDELLIRVASEVGRLVRRNEIFCRLGGDEFVLILPMATAGQATALAARIVACLAELRFQTHEQTLRLSGSLGVALYPLHAAEAETLLSRADTAMYEAKQSGKNAWRLYQPQFDTHQALVAELGWKERIGRALEQGGFALEFQGVYAMPGRRLSHLEALVRMRDADNGGLISPGMFIPLAEKNGQVLAIDRWVVRETILLLSADDALPPIAINVSGRSFEEPDFPDYIAEQLAKFRVAPARLIVEVTETAAVADLLEAERFIQRLRAIGCRICLDDFGAGFASFAYLKHMQADTIKIDGLFIRKLPSDEQNQVFVKAMVEVARGLGVTTVAECVEDEDTLAMLTAFGVDLVQGYYLGRPGALPAVQTWPTTHAQAGRR